MKPKKTPRIHPLLRSASRKQLYKYLKEGWSEQGKREILAEIARRKKKHGNDKAKEPQDNGTEIVQA